MRLSTSALLFATSVAALSRHECLTNSHADLAAYADCGKQEIIASCLSHLKSFMHSDVRSCYLDAGCSTEEAEIESKYTLSRCDDMSHAGELRKRYRAMNIPRADPTTTEEAAKKSDDPKATTGGAKTGTDCFTTGIKSTTECDTETIKGRVITNTCVPTTVTTSQCNPGMTCSHDASNLDICMDLHDTLDTAGIVVAIVFGIIITTAVGAITFLCCKDRNEQKRLAAKAEAVALARAATKKQRNQQDRAPLIRNASGGSNPFQDQPRV